MTPDTKQQIKKLDKEIAKLKKDNERLKESWNWQHQYSLDLKSQLAEARECAYKDLILKLLKERY